MLQGPFQLFESSYFRFVHLVCVRQPSKNEVRAIQKKLGYDDYFKPKIALKVCTENIQPTLNLAKRQKNIRARKARKKLNNAHSNLELL